MSFYMKNVYNLGGWGLGVLINSITYITKLKTYINMYNIFYIQINKIISPTLNPE